jgi:crotonobetainyl-CoA:carnitine CoA-transferase CaiB-like acyl-CoA transferase
LGRPDLAADPRFATNAQRKANEAALAQIIERITLEQSSEYWYRRLEAAGVPCGVLQTIDQVVHDLHLAARGFILDLPQSRLGMVRSTGSPIHLSETPIRLDHAGPSLGEHTAQILDELGIPAAERAALARAGVFGRPEQPAD